MKGLTADRRLPWDWYDGTIPENVAIHESVYMESALSFELCGSQLDPAVTIGRGSAVYQGTMFDLGPRAKVRIGEFALVHAARIICDDEVVIGDHALISWRVVIMDTPRWPTDEAARRRQLEQVPGREPRRPGSGAPARPVHIGPNTWIGFDACLLPGVSVGRGSIVGARAVVVEDVPEYCIVGGNPARVLRHLDPPGST